MHITDFQIIRAKLNLETAHNAWHSLYDKNQHSFFLSWAWLETWIKTLPDDIDVEIVLAKQNNQPIAAFAIGVSNSEFLRSSSAIVGATGIPELDNITIEKNGLLISEALSDQTLSLTQCMDAIGAKTLSIPGIDQEQLQATEKKIRLNHWKRRTVSKPNHFTCLEKVRQADAGFLSLLSTNKRRQIKKSNDLLSENGALTVTQATSTEQARQFLDELIELHKKEWNRRGHGGAFSSHFTYSFHINLIDNHFQNGQIRIYRISNSHKTIGVIYGFLSTNDFLFYQSGFSYDPTDNRFKPGLTCHSLLIDKLAKEGLRRYDFLAGDSQYKKSLGTDSYTMHWVDFYSDHMTTKIKYFLQTTLKQKLKPYLAPLLRK